MEARRQSGGAQCGRVGGAGAVGLRARNAPPLSNSLPPGPGRRPSSNSPLWFATGSLDQRQANAARPPAPDPPGSPSLSILPATAPHAEAWEAHSAGRARRASPASDPRDEGRAAGPSSAQPAEPRSAPSAVAPQEATCWVGAPPLSQHTSAPLGAPRAPPLATPSGLVARRPLLPALGEGGRKEQGGGGGV